VEGQEEDDIESAAEREALGGYSLSAPPPPTPAQYRPMSDMDILRQAGGGDLNELHHGGWDARAASARAQDAQAQGQMAAANSSAYRSYLAASEKAQIAQAKALEKQNDPFFRAQNIYGQTGNLAAARVIAKTTGPAMFKLGEQVDLGPDQMFSIRPVGDLDIPKPDGTSVKVPTWQFLRANKVNVVPFLGGDEAAIAFRGMAARMGEVLVALHRLEEGYTASGNVSVPYTERKFDLTQIEGTLARDVSQLRSGSKSMAGVSDKEMEAIEKTLPSSATNLRDSKAEGIRRIINTRQQLLGLITRVARMNGVELVQLKAKDAPTTGRTPRPAGVRIIPNGEQSGSSTSGQPR
jgi:hypothetical protein